MSKSKIEWCDYTFNPWWGCTKVSPGCKNCYAEGIAKRFHFGEHIWGETADRRFFPTFRKPLAWNNKAEKSQTRLKVFCGSMCDIFEDREDLIIYRLELWETIKQTPWLDWLLLTKRPENVIEMMPPEWVDGFATGHYYSPQSNIWIGASVENQAAADKRIPELLRIPIKKKFLSVEPMLAEINLNKIVGENVFFDALGKSRFDYGDDGWGVAAPMPDGIDWVIVGGESGPNKRPFNPDWARSIRDQCKGAGVPFFMKQWDKKKPIPDDLMIREFPDSVSVDRSED